MFLVSPSDHGVTVEPQQLTDFAAAGRVVLDGGGLGIDMSYPVHRYFVSYPVHRYFVAAKHYEFALGGATAQLRRIGSDLANGLPASADKVRDPF